MKRLGVVLQGIVLLLILVLIGLLVMRMGSKPRLDQSLALSYIGRHLLIGVTYLDHNDTVIEQKQFHGRIVRINETEGIVVQLANSGSEFKVPPDLRGIEKALKGEYRLRSSGEVVVDPDLIANWPINKPPPGK
jgi:hypothetical protein